MNTNSCSSLYVYLCIYIHTYILKLFGVLPFCSLFAFVHILCNCVFYFSLAGHINQFQLHKLTLVRREGCTIRSPVPLRNNSNERSRRRRSTATTPTTWAYQQIRESRILNAGASASASASALIERDDRQVILASSWPQGKSKCNWCFHVVVVCHLHAKLFESLPHTCNLLRWPTEMRRPLWMPTKRSSGRIDNR